MKMTNTRNVSRKSGMTLLELTVVILVLLSLISILFIGARAWKKGSDRAGCIMNIRNVQQAVRGHQNMNNLIAGTELVAATKIWGANGYLNAPNCPGGGGYVPTETVPGPGVLYLTCTLAGTLDHVPTGTGDW